MRITFARLVYSLARLVAQISVLAPHAQQDTIYSIIVAITVRLTVPLALRAMFAIYAFQDTSLTMVTALAYQVLQDVSAA
jgi:hypothetical protein